MATPQASKYLDTAIDPTIMAREFNLKPDRSAYYIATNHDRDETYTAQFAVDTAILVTILGAQPLHTDYIDEIEEIDADTFDDDDVEA